MTSKRTYRYRPASASRSPLMTARTRRRRRPRVMLLLAVVVLIGAGAYAVLGNASTAPDPSDEAAHTGETTTTAELENYVLAYPTFLGGGERNTSGDGDAPSSLDLVWKVNVGSGLTARKSDNRLVTWSGTGWTGQPTLTYENGIAYLVIGGYDHGLRRIEAERGSVVWRAELDDVIKGTNTVYYDPHRPPGDRLVVVTGSRRGNDYDVGDPGIAPLRAFSFETSEEIWRLPISRSDNYSQDVDASPLMVDGRLIVAIEPGYVLALDISELTPTTDGHVQPTVVASSPALYTEEDIAAHAENGGSNLALEGSPAVLGDRIYIASSSGHVYGLDRETLAIEWDFNPGGDFDGTVVVTPEDMLLVGLEKQYVKHGGVFMLDPSKSPDECVVWFFATEDRGIGEWTGGVVGSVAIGTDANGAPIAAFNSVDGNLYVVSRDVMNGTSPSPDGNAKHPRPRLLFSDYVGGSIATPAVVGTRIVTCGLDNTVRLYEMTANGPETAFAEVDTFVADGPFESTPLVWDGRVYIGCRDGYLYCLGGQ